ncbi:P2 family phage major capsid protein, partial [Escherichia coli]|nr:P2 family phage major capsid protein [Escherichia coli]
MKNSTREKYDAWCLLQASQNKLNSSKLDGISFSLTPSASQTIVDKMQESADLLKQINILEVDEQEEESIGLTSVPLSSTNNSTTEARQPVQGCTAETDRYRCEQVNTDTYVSYEKLDQWAGLDNFFGHMESQIYRRQALDVILTGIYGTHHAAKSDITANPLLQD